jgi:polyhydroxyalkanoate synthesis repressor PhaR
LETQIQNQQAEAQSQGVTITNPNAKIIKRYQNRKLYDTQQSCYVTLEDIAKMIRNNEEVVVIDNKTKKDITSTTLTQIIFEAEKKAKNFISIDTLREIIQTGSGSISSYLEKMLPAGAARPAAVAAAPSNGSVAHAAATVGDNANLDQLLENTTRSFDDIQKKLEDRIRVAGGNNGVADVQERINQLHQKLSTIETKIRQYELEQ